MGDPISERAHYVLAAEAEVPAALFLIQQGRLEQPGFVAVIWDRPYLLTVATRLRRAIAHALASLVMILL